MPKIQKRILTYKTHQERWSKCQLCDLAKLRHNVVLLRGTVPCKVLFVGEAPGDSEDRLGRPFVEGAPAGELMQHIIDRSQQPKPYTYALTNLVACLPPRLDKKYAPPPALCVSACSPRLMECIELAKPEIIVTVGKPARDRFTMLLHMPQVAYVDIVHPSSILQGPEAGRGLVIERTIAILRDAVDPVL